MRARVRDFSFISMAFKRVGLLITTKYLYRCGHILCSACACSLVHLEHIICPIDGQPTRVAGGDVSTLRKTSSGFASLASSHANGACSHRLRVHIKSLAGDMLPIELGARQRVSELKRRVQVDHSPNFRILESELHAVFIVPIRFALAGIAA